MSIREISEAFCEATGSAEAKKVEETLNLKFEPKPIENRFWLGISGHKKTAH